MFTLDQINERYQCHISGNENHRIGVAVGLINKNNHILLERRKDCGWWGITGGKLELGETIENCALREIFEETGLNLNKEDLQFINVFSNPKDGRILQYPDKRSHLVDLVYICYINKNQFIISDESYELKLFDINKLPIYIVPPSVKPLERIKDILLN